MVLADSSPDLHFPSLSLVKIDQPPRVLESALVSVVIHSRRDLRRGDIIPLCHRLTDRHFFVSDVIASTAYKYAIFSFLQRKMIFMTEITSNGS